VKNGNRVQTTNYPYFVVRHHLHLQLVAILCKELMSFLWSLGHCTMAC